MPLVFWVDLWDQAGFTKAMLHRHLNHQQYTLAAIDDIIARGHRSDWEALREAVLADPSLGGKIEQVCRPHLGDAYAQRYHFWNHYVQERVEKKREPPMNADQRR